MPQALKPAKVINRWKLPANYVSGIGLVPSPDSRLVAYVKKGILGVHVGVNGKMHKRLEEVCSITFSANSDALAYVVRRKGKCFVMSAEHESQSWDDIGTSSPALSPDGRHVAYTAKRGTEWFAIMNDEIIGGPYEGFVPGGIVFSPNSQRMAYGIKKNNTWQVVVDAEEKEPFATIKQRSIRFSPDSHGVAYVAGLTGSWIDATFSGEDAVVLNDKILKVWKCVNGVERGFRKRYVLVLIRTGSLTRARKRGRFL